MKKNNDDKGNWLDRLADNFYLLSVIIVILCAVVYFLGHFEKFIK